jgi:hypothetical protein
MLPGLTPRTCTVPLLQFPLHPINHPFHSIQQWRHSSLAPHARSLSPAPAPTLHDSNQIVRTKKNREERTTLRLLSSLWCIVGLFRQTRLLAVPAAPSSLSLLSFMGYRGRGSSFRGPTRVVLPRALLSFRLLRFPPTFFLSSKSIARKKKRKGEGRKGVRSTKTLQGNSRNAQVHCGFLLVYITSFILFYMSPNKRQIKRNKRSKLVLV